MHACRRHAHDLFGGLPDAASQAFGQICGFCDEHAAEVNAALPWLAAELGHNDGYATMLRFVRVWSGMRLYVAKDHAQFTARTGFDLSAATHRRLVHDVGAGQQVDVPSAWGVFLALRRAAVSIAVRSGTPAREVSRQFGVTMRSLR